MTPTHTASGQPITIGSSTDPFYGAPNTGTGVIDQSLISETTTGQTRWTIYAMETGFTKGVRRYSVVAVTEEEAIENVLSRNTIIGTWDVVTFEVFVEGSGLEYRYERALRRVER